MNWQHPLQLRSKQQTTVSPNKMDTNSEITEPRQILGTTHEISAVHQNCYTKGEEILSV